MTIKFHPLYYLSICLGILLFANCGTTKNAQAMNPAVMPFETSRLMGTPWRLYNYQEKNLSYQVDSTLEVTIAFEQQKDTSKETRFYGRAACNRYFGTCILKENQLTIHENMGITRMMCPPNEMNMETLFIRMLPKMTKMEFVENAKTKKIDLVLSNDNHEKLIFYPYNLE